MQKNIHPKNDLTTFRCGCGATFETLSTKTNVILDICSSCHPFYTGKQKFIDIAGRVDRYNKRFAQKSEPKKEPEAKEEKTEEAGK
ncbi:MAG: 50S ribosomal protein L31 [Candidatus Cloacimonadota bacterium]|nr:MAG: 50S ribosomal protein L31 [Candidatus Cloacimonadota bacterium]